MKTPSPLEDVAPSSGLQRRSFCQTLLAGAGAVLGAPTLLRGEARAATQGPNGPHFHEPAHDLSVCDDADVIVCGGGPAGVAAAIAAARAGARTRLFELHGCLGGVWTAGLLTFIFDFDKPGLTREILQKLERRDARRGTNRDRFVYEPEEMKLLLEEMCTAAGVKVLLHTCVAAAYREGNRLTTVVTESKSGRQAWRAPVFIDATGDGDLGAQAGCQWDTGQRKDCPCQPLTLNALAVVRDASKMGDFISFFDGKVNMSQHVKATQNFLAEIRRAGCDPSYGMPTLFQARENLLLVMINHEYGIKAFDAAAISDATLRARTEIFKIVGALSTMGGVWEGMRLVASAEQIGVRDGRRIHGRYTVTREDLVRGARHADGVARVTFGADIHAANREKNRTETIAHGGFATQPYDIPLRAMIAKDVDGLLMAGRCISGDFIAHASYRVTGDAVAMGEAAGAVAALAARSKRLPHDVPWEQAAELLRQTTRKNY
jgi:hypothetical protein